MEFNETNKLLNYLGQPGRYAWIVCIFLGCNYFQLAFNNMLMSVIGAVPNHHCKLPDGIITNNQSIPEINGVLDSCHVYKNFTFSSGEYIECPDGWEYALEEAESTIVNEWDLVCNKRYLPSLATTVYFAGVMAGGLICGPIADFMGRLPMVVFSIFCPILLGMMVYLVENVRLFMLLRFVVGITQQALQLSFYVLSIELTENSQTRVYINAVFHIAWSVGLILLSGIAYVCKGWRVIQLVITLPFILSIAFIWFIPESLRWQINKGKFRDALLNIRRIAKFNKVTLPDSVPDTLRKVCEEKQYLEESVVKKQYNLLDAFRTPNLRKRTLILCFMWFVGCMTYYGLSLQASRLSGSKYLNFFINGAVDLVPTVLGIIINKRLSRRLVICVYLVVAGILCILAAVIPKETGSGSDISWLSTMLVWMGKFCIVGCFDTLFLFTMELFPTVIRNAGFGACTFWTRVGALVSPQINMIADYSYSWIPILIYGSMSMIAGFLTLLLPDTRTLALPDTLEEAEAMGITKQQDAVQYNGNEMNVKMQLKCDPSVNQDT